MSASAGRVLLIPRGSYDDTEEYHPLDLVYYQGSTYLCKAPSTGNVPTNTTYFQIFAQGTASAAVAGNYYGTCDTAAGTATKVVTIPAAENFVLQVGDIIGVKFDNTNTAEDVMLNVNGTGAFHVFYGNSAVTTSNLFAGGEAGRITVYQYDGTNWVWISHDVDENSDDARALKTDIAPIETSPTSHAYQTGDLLYYSGVLYKTKTAIGIGDTLTVGTNIETADVDGKINVAVDALLEREFYDLYGLCTKTTTIGTNQQGNKEITEVDSGASITAVTVINTVNGNKQIVTTVTPTAGDYYYIKTTIIASTSSGKTITETYTKEVKA